MPEQIIKDELTTFYLKNGLFPFLNELINKSHISSKNLSIILIDIDHFKRYNDKHGHLFGDEVLKYATSMFRLSFSNSDRFSFFRYGGDEFIAMLPDITAKEAQRFAYKFRYNMSRRPFLYKGKFFKIHVSSGIASFPSDANNAHELIKSADRAMYFSKRHGRNTITMASMIKYLVARNILLLAITCVILLVFGIFAYKYYLHQHIRKTVAALKTLKVSVSPINSDSVFLKDGTVLNGKIVKETNLRLVLSIYPEKGIMITVNLKKSEIEQIEYGSKTTSKERYEQYREKHPNPHWD